MGFWNPFIENSLQLALLARGLRVETEVAVPVFFAEAMWGISALTWLLTAVPA
jgi:hypothetical protein